MQFSRNNHPQSSDLSNAEDDAVDPAQPGLRRQNLADLNQSAIEQAPWQAAFRLAPNVRFTRTPESALARKTNAGQAPAEQAEAPVAEQIEVIPSEAFLIPTADDSQAAGEALSAPIEQIAGLQQLAATMRYHVPEMPAVAVAQPEPFQEVASIVVPRRDIAISDFAFWDAMPFELEGPVVIETEPLPIEPEILPVVVAKPGAPVTDLYREVPRRTAARTVVVAPSPRPEPVKGPEPVAPVRVAPQRVVKAKAPVVVEPLPAPIAQVPLPAPAPVVAAEPAPVQQPAPVQPEILRPRTVRPAEAEYEFPPISLLQEPQGERGQAMQPDALQQSAGLLESILEDFGIRGEIIDVRPGPVVTLYEFEPAPGVKSSRVIGLADDIARSMSALSARVAVVPGRNVIGIELPNATRETVYFRELIECEDYWETKHRLALCLGKTIGGEPVIAELAKMPHLLVAGTTGSGKSVAINTMILSLLYRLRPEECRLIMIDPKMLELSVYDGIPHLLTPVVTDPKKAVLALKWAVREMEDRYKKMSRLAVRNIDGYNQRAASAREKGEVITVSVQAGFDRQNGEIIYEEQEMDLSPMPYIVVIVDEMADLMMVAGKDIEGAIQRLAQMARAAGIHLIMATQRPSVDVITGTIKANFPTRISFQVTSKIDSRTILGEQGAEHLLGQGDMLHMAGGGRISRVHGPFVSDAEVELVVRHLKTQGRPDYLGTVTEDEDDEEDEDVSSQEAVFDKSAMGGDDSDELYDKAVKVVMKDRKCSTSYIQRRLSVGYNRAASLVERMEQEGLVGPANHVGKREIIAGGRSSTASEDFGD
ncbi:DNA translocase FtsK [Neorhizobium galegae]|uniref:DNA translocase FtsK n=1 Tax=Neorhizobium galegae TaxID=399 RepID=UPI0006211003|nr:DNA translocase FtsK [Neorhizobium galegae]CDZ25802.1 Cell division FtsK/SpoIIIE [Neorhizobium galegae bv. officinalis]KAA9388536.1 DNA translocase FtsK [Neorhizobium galegae]KAB1114070.1 DNA translocase FtsK [Neorhizobium galegae]MCM2497009.1 FtsK/SpoIIIE domain-containing protein [Neorhizobium galegae]MCQ1771077.1 FtsK/SpoIIIE domain-containing protein [Neorhizobium galegae]